MDIDFYQKRERIKHSIFHKMFGKSFSIFSLKLILSTLLPHFNNNIIISFALHQATPIFFTRHSITQLHPPFALCLSFHPIIFFPPPSLSLSLSPSFSQVSKQRMEISESRRGCGCNQKAPVRTSPVVLHPFTPLPLHSERRHHSNTQ